MVRRNKHRFFSWICPECGRIVEELVNMKTSGYLHWGPLCWECDVDMERYDAEEEKILQDKGMQETSVL